MPHSFPNIGNAAEFVGQTPWSARVPLTRSSLEEPRLSTTATGRRGRRPRSRGTAPRLMQVLGYRKSMRHYALSGPCPHSCGHIFPSPIDSREYPERACAEGQALDGARPSAFGATIVIQFDRTRAAASRLDHYLPQLIAADGNWPAVHRRIPALVPTHLYAQDLAGAQICGHARGTGRAPVKFGGRELHQVAGQHNVGERTGAARDFVDDVAAIAPEFGHSREFFLMIRRPP